MRFESNQGAWHVIATQSFNRQLQAISCKHDTSNTHQDIVVFTQIYFIPTSSTAKQWLQKSVTPQGAQFFILVLASAIHHTNIYVTIKGSQNFNLGSRNAYIIFTVKRKSLYHDFNCITSTGKHAVRRKCESKDEKDRKCTYKSNIEAHSRNHCWSKRTVSITYTESVCVCSLSYTAFKAHAPYYTVICGLFGSTIFFHIMS
jgi:hypothetical protein